MKKVHFTVSVDQNVYDLLKQKAGQFGAINKYAARVLEKEAKG